MTSRRVLPLPMTLEQIDADWLTAALRTRAPAVTVRAAQIVDVNRGTCTKIRLRLDLDDEGKRAGIPETVILKGGFEPHSREWHSMHDEEVRAYQFVFPELGLPSPNCYFAQYEESQRQGLVIMEDLVARGVEFCNALRPQTQEQVARRLTLLARFHAKTWGSRELAPEGHWGWVPESAQHTRDYMRQYLSPAVWQRFVDSPRGAAVSVIFHDREWMIDALDRILKLSNRVPHSVLHSDTHLGNLYIDTDGTPCFFDMLPHRGPPISELAYHIPCALDLSDRKRLEGTLVQGYLDELKSQGIDAPSFDEAMYQYGVLLARGYLIFLINETHFQTEAVNTAYTARFSAAMLDHRTVDLLNTIS